MPFCTWKQSFNIFQPVLVLNFHFKSLESILGSKITFRNLKLTFDSNFKIFKSFRNFLIKSTLECYFVLGNKVSTDSNQCLLEIFILSL